MPSLVGSEMCIRDSLLFWSPFFLVCRFFSLFTLFLLYPRMYLLPVCIQLKSIYEGCCCCIYDLQHSPSWLLLLLLIVDQLVYHAVLLLCHIYHPARAF